MRTAALSLLEATMLLALSLVFVGCGGGSNSMTSANTPAAPPSSNAGAAGGGSGSGSNPASESPTQHFVYVGASGMLQIFKTGSDGSVQSSSSMKILGQPTAGDLALSPNGRFLYVGDTVYGDRASQGQNTLEGFTVDTGSGALNPIPGSPFNGPVTLQPAGIAVSQDGQYLITFVSQWAFQVYKIEQTTGALTLGQTVQIAWGNDSGSKKMLLSADGNSVYAMSPTRLIAATFSAGAITVVTSLELGYRDIALSKDGQYLYASAPFDPHATSPTWGRMIDIYTTSGGLTKVGSFDPGAMYTALTIDPTGKFLYAANQDGILEFKVSGTSLAPATQANLKYLLGGVTAMGFDRQRNVLYTDKLGINGDVIGFAENPSDGSLTPLTTDAAAGPNYSASVVTLGQ